MTDPFISNSQTNTVLEQELQRLQQENKRLREANTKLQMQLTYASSKGGSGAGSGRLASVRSGGSQRSTGSRVSQLRRVASVAALGTTPYEVRASGGGASAAAQSNIASALVSSPVGASAPFGAAPRRTTDTADTRDFQSNSRAEDDERKMHGDRDDGDDEDDRGTAGARPRGKLGDVQRRLLKAESEAASAVAACKEAEKSAQGLRKESQRVRSRFESFVNYTCEREEGYNAVFAKIHAELMEAQARCERFQAQSAEDRQALLEAEQAHQQQRQQQAPEQQQRRQSAVLASAVPDNVIEACEALEKLLGTSSQGESEALNTVTAFLRTAASHASTHGPSAAGGTLTTRRRRAGADASSTATAASRTQSKTRRPRTAHDPGADPAATTAAAAEEEDGSQHEDEQDDDEHTHSAEALGGPPQLRLVKGGASLRSDAALQAALEKATAAAAKARQKPPAASTKRTAKRPRATSTVGADEQAFALSRFAESQGHDEAQRARTVRTPFVPSPEDPIGSFLSVHHSQREPSARALLRDDLLTALHHNVKRLAEHAVQYLCRRRSPLHGEDEAPDTATITTTTTTSSADLAAVVRQVDADLEALDSVHPDVRELLVAGLREHLVRLMTRTWLDASERAAQLSAVQLTATALRRVLWLDVVAARRGARGADAIAAAFARAMEHLLPVVFDLTLAMLRAWRGLDASDDLATDPRDDPHHPVATAATVSGLVGPTPRRIRLVDRWVCATEALCLRTSAEQREAAAAAAPVEALPRRRVTYVIQALLSTCVGIAVREAEAMQDDALPDGAVAAFWRARWCGLCDALGWSTAQLPLDALGRAAVVAVSQGVRAGIDVTRTAAHKDAILAMRLIIAYHGYPCVQAVKEQLAQELGGEGQGDLVTEPFAQWMSYAVIDLGLKDARDALWSSTTSFFMHYLRSVGAEACRSPEEMVAELRPTHVLVARALLQLCGDALHGGGVLTDAMDDASTAEAATLLRGLVQWVLEQRAAVVVAEARQEPPQEGPRRHPLLDTAMGQRIVRVCTGAALAAKKA